VGGVSVASRPVDRSVGPVSAGGVSVAAPPIDLSAGPISMGGVRVAPCPIDLSAGIVCTGFVRALRVVDLDPGTFEVDVAPPVTLPGTSLAEKLVHGTSRCVTGLRREGLMLGQILCAGEGREHRRHNRAWLLCF